MSASMTWEWNGGAWVLIVEGSIVNWVRWSASGKCYVDMYGKPVSNDSLEFAKKMVEIDHAAGAGSEKR